MLGFAIPVKHPRNSRSYRHVGELLSRTLQSVLRQTGADVAVVVVANEIPPVSVSDSRVRHVSVTFPPPVDKVGPEAAFRGQGYLPGIRDKAAKLAVGVSELRRMNAGHIMFVDSDDLVSRRIGAFVEANSGEPGWYSTTGFIHPMARRHVHDVADEFHRKCGSSAIVRSDLIPVPSTVTNQESRDEVLLLCGERNAVTLLGRHGNWDQELSRHQEIMGSLPFPGAIWEIGTGENASGTFRSGRDRIKLTWEIAEEFGLPIPGLWPSLVAATTSRYRARF
jgi:hypothetical protein